MATQSYTLGGSMSGGSLPPKKTTGAAPGGIGQLAPLPKVPSPVQDVSATGIKPTLGGLPSGPMVNPPAPAVGGPSILPPAPTGDTAVAGGKQITSYAGGSGPQINPPAPMTGGGPTPILPPPSEGVTSGPGQTPFGNPGGPQINPSYQPLPQGNGGITSFGPGNDLISSQVNPTVSGRTGDTMSAVDAARNALAGGPNRADLAQQYTSQWNDATEPQYQADLRRATQLGAANGRIGSGMLSTSYGDITANRANQRDVAQRGFLTDALGGTIQDRQNNLSALSGLESQQYGQDAANRNEVRGERGYQQGLSQQSFTNDAQRLALEEALTQGSYGRGSDRLNQLIQMGLMGNPGTTYLGASGQVQQGAQQSNQALSDLLSQYFLGQGVGG